MGLRGDNTGGDEPSAIAARGLADLVGARQFIDVTIPRTKIAAKMRLASRSERALIKVATRKTLGLAMDANALLGPGVMEEWSLEIAVRTLATVVRDPIDVDKPLDEVETWRELLDDDQINGLWNVYQDLAERLDPLGANGVALSDHEHSQLVSALKKKDVDLLSAFGSRKLATFFITTVEPPAI